jgi:putative ABC transport system permease protein
VEDEELRREMEAHIAHEADENVARGMSAEEARRRALVKFGSRANVREDLWQWNTIGIVDRLVRDVGQVLRVLRRSPGFALAVIVVMALGVGAVTAMFTIVRSVLLKPLPFGDADQLVTMAELSSDGTNPYNAVAPGIFDAWQTDAKSFDGIALFQNGEYTLSASGGQLPERIAATLCSWKFFPALSVQAAIGRVFGASDDDASANGTVILSWALWKRRFAGDREILNRKVQLNGDAYTVIGVMPAWFSYPDAKTQMWLPAYHEIAPMSMDSRENHAFYVLARLKSGVGVGQAQSETDTIIKRIRGEYPDEVIGRGATMRPLMEDLVGEYKTPLYVLLAATVCVLVIASLNAANLFVARAAARRKELAIRSSLGASRRRLVWEQLLESLLLSGIGGAVGMVLAHAAVRWVAYARQDLARVEAIQMDWTVAGFATAAVLLGGCFAGTVSTVSSGNERMAETLREASRTHTGGQSKMRLRKALLTLETGLTVVLLIAAGLLLKSYETLRTTDLGCATQNVLSMQVALASDRYQTSALRAGFFERLAREVRSLPGVERAGLVTRPPGAGYVGDNSFEIAENPPLAKGEFQFAIRRFVDPGYFEAMGIPLLRGRTFREGERLDKAKVVIISDLLARQCFHGEDPIGRHLRVSPGVGSVGDYEIVGVVGDTKYSIAKPAGMMAYYPLYSGKAGLGFIVVRAKQDALGIALPVQKLIAEMDPDLAVSDVLTMEQVVGRSTTSAGFNTKVTLGFAGLSLVLAAVGLYGVLAYLVAQRSSEIGVRMALGARRGQVLGLVLADGMRPALAGLALGLMGGVGAAQMIRELLYGVKPMDVSVFVRVAVILLCVAGMACAMPAWRASKLDPAQTLRME